MMRALCRRALWRGFMQACNDTEQVASMNGMDSAGAQLDWFGVPVKAAEIPVWTARMKMLARKVPFLMPDSCCLPCCVSQDVLAHHAIPCWTYYCSPCLPS